MIPCEKSYLYRMPKLCPFPSSYFEDRKIKKIVVSTNMSEYSWLLCRKKLFESYQPVAEELVVHHR